MEWAQTGKFAPYVLTSDNLHILLDILARKNIQFPSILNYGQHQHHEVNFDQREQRIDYRLGMLLKGLQILQSISEGDDNNLIIFVGKQHHNL